MFLFKRRNKRLQCYDRCTNFFYQPIKNDLKTYNNILKIATIQGNDYATGCLLDYTYFKEHYNLIAIDLSKQQRLDVDPKERAN